MDKELQDLAWSILPKEFKEEVKKLYKEFYNEKPHSDCSYGYLGLLIKLFGIHNLTSDAEGEEMLTVPRKDIIELYQEVQKTISQCKGTGLAMQSIGIINVLWSFFGSKCLPDNVDSLDGNVDSLANLSEKPTPSATSDTSDTQADPEPCTEPEENVNLSQESANCDKQFDNILKGGFREHNRLHIAVMIMASMMQNAKWGDKYSHIAQLACAAADALLSECGKGGKDGN